MGLAKDIEKYDNEFKKFLRYLKDNGIYNSYFNNLRSNRNEYNIFNSIYAHNLKVFFSTCQPQFWLTDCFCWADQKEGNDFWENFHVGWQNKFFNNEI